jgi:hypothetical protein
VPPGLLNGPVPCDTVDDLVERASPEMRVPFDGQSQRTMLGFQFWQNKVAPLLFQGRFSREIGHIGIRRVPVDIEIRRCAEGGRWYNNLAIRGLAAPGKTATRSRSYDRFKIDLGDPSQLASFLGELVAEIYSTLCITTLQPHGSIQHSRCR